uniref:BZIP protein 7 n=1 Tax=Lonicera japonica TaxID=105884 RepID=A0A4Y1JT15_LONJA|nr:bZIP protein 7 [Lonicera japonica]
MGIQTMGFHGSDQQSHVLPLSRQNSWYSLKLNEVKKHLGELGKPLGSMNLDELLKNIWTAESNLSNGEMDIDNVSLRHEAILIRAFGGKTVDEVWREIKKGDRSFEEVKIEEGESTLGEMTLEDFLVKAGIFVAEASLGPTMCLGNALVKQTFLPQTGLSPSTSIDTLSDTPKPSRKRGAVDAIEKTLERRLRRKIKNRESAARSRARKQAYHNELVSKVTHLEEENLKLRKEKETDQLLSFELSPEPRYQLRRTSSL